MNKKINKKFIKINKNVQMILVGIFVQTLYLFVAYNFYQIGFPLDDSWIHQTYARNLVEYGQWFFIPGIPSAGSTSPLWTLLLTPGFFIKSNFYFIWTFSLSGVLLISSAIIFEKLFEHVTNKSYQVPWAGFIFLLEWHLVWSANSGMETILYIFFILSIFYYLITNQSKKIWIYWLLLGFVIFVRPDGITLVGPYLLLNFIYFVKKKTISIKNSILSMLVILICIFLYGFFNFRLSGDYLPNTFFAKQAEYQILYAKPLLTRYFELFLVSITGVGVLLFPGFLYFLVVIIREKKWEMIAVYLWFLGYLLIYAVRLPVTYQHGRYIIPTIPIYLLLSLSGLNLIFQGVFARRRLYLFGYKVAIGAVLVIFFMMGARVFAEDVAIIQSEMVESALWINENLAEDSIIAAHDIGALGFFSNRQILDLAGLISPEVIPFIRDEGQLSDYMDANNVDYLMIFPDWYAELDQSKTKIYSTRGVFSPQAGGENMSIFIWK